MNALGTLSRRQVRDYDAAAIAAGIPGPVLMENAARGAVDLLLSLGVRGPIAIVCGKGNNGGDGFAMARLLQTAGAAVSVELAAAPEGLQGDARTAFAPLKPLGVPLHQIRSSEPRDFARRLALAEWIVDAVLGTGAVGPVHPDLAAIIDAINAARRRVLAVDLPSGLDADSGEPLGPAVRAACTATFVAQKRGFSNPRSAAYTGEVYVVPIGGGRLTSAPSED
jgi:NAD(P)H-hydrate epimerase